MALKTHAFVSVFDLCFPSLLAIRQPELMVPLFCLSCLAYQAWIPLTVVALNFGTLRETGAILWGSIKDAVSRWFCGHEQLPLFDVQQ